MEIHLRIPRPDQVDLPKQGRRGPFAPIIMALEAMTQINEWLIRQGGYPSLYRSGVIYQTEEPGTEELVSYDEMLVRGWGDCGHLAPVRAAELRSVGISARCCIRWKWVPAPNGVMVMLIHVMVLWPDGSIEDPSRLLGMRGEA